MLFYFSQSALCMGVVYFLSDTQPIPGLSLVDKWGIAGLCMLIVFVLYKRDEKRETTREDERKAMEAERLEVQKSLLALQESHNENLTELLERVITSHNEVALAMKGLQCKGHSTMTLHNKGGS